MTKTLASTTPKKGHFGQNLGRIAEYGVRPIAWLGQISELLPWNLTISHPIYCSAACTYRPATIPKSSFCQLGILIVQRVRLG